MMLTILTVILVVLVVSSGILSASETALFSLSSMKVRALKQGDDVRGKRAAFLLSNPQKLLVTILMLNVLMNILVQNVVASIFGTFSGWLITVGIPLALTLIFGEVIPKSIALGKNEWIAVHMSTFLLIVERVTKPVRDAITWITNAISRLAFFFLRKEKEISIEELKHALHASKEFGVLGDNEVKLMRGFLNLEDDVLKELMCPRQEILYYDIHQPLDKLEQIFVNQECSRVPICDSSLEKVLGIMSANSFFLHKPHIHSSMELLTYVKKPIFVPESMLGIALLKQFYESKETMVIVVDEYGSISGLITLEDLVEVVIGQIVDKRDEAKYYSRSSEDVMIASGKLELIEFEDIFDIHLHSPNNMATLGGYLTELAGDIPKSGQKFVTDKLLFHVLDADKTKVRRVYVRRLKSSRKKGEAKS